MHVETRLRDSSHLLILIDKQGRDVQNETAVIESFFPPLPAVKTPESLSPDDARMEIVDEKPDVLAAPQTPGAVSNSNKRTRGPPEDVPNGVSSGGEKGSTDKRKRRKTANPNSAATTISSAAISNTPVEEPLTTHGMDVGIQAEEKTKEVDPRTTIEVPVRSRKFNAIAWNPVDKLKLLTGPQGAEAQIWSIPEQFKPDQLSKSLLDHSSTAVKKQEVTAIAWSTSGDKLVTGAYDGSIRVWDTVGTQIAAHFERRIPLAAIKWNKSSTLILAMHADGVMSVWELGMTDSIGSTNKQQDAVWIDDNKFASADHNGLTHIYAAQTEGSKKTLQLLKTLQNPDARTVCCLAWDTVSSKLACGNDLGKITVSSLKTTEPFDFI